MFKVLRSNTSSNKSFTDMVLLRNRELNCHCTENVIELTAKEREIIALREKREIPFYFLNPMKAL